MKNKITGTKEWASSNENIMFGCQHDCRYCYAKAMSVRHKKIDIARWDQPILRDDKLHKSIGKRKGTIMFPTTHDIHPDNINSCLMFLRKLLIPGNQVLIVSKPHYKSIEVLVENLYQFRDQILFRFSIGSANDEVLKYWEPHAPLFQERLDSLELAFDSGFQTSISCEPMLDNKIHDVVRVVSPFVTDSIWLGKMNQGPSRCLINNGDLSVMKKAAFIETILQDDQAINALYREYQYNPKIKWKESIKKVVGLDLSETKGLDV